MEIFLALLSGFLLGGLVVHGLMIRADRRTARPHLLDEQYGAAKRAVARHFKRHDTLNLAGMERLIDGTGLTAMRYLDQLQRDGCVKMQDHRGTGAFYTRP